MTQELFNNTMYTSFIVLCIIFLLSLINLRSDANYLKIVTLFLGFSVLIEIGAKALWYFKMNNLILLHVYTFGEFIIMVYFYYHMFSKHRKIRKRILYGSPFLLIFILLNSIFLQPPIMFNSFSKLVVGLSICYLSITYFIINLVEKKDSAKTIINSAFLFYYASSVFIFLLSNTYTYIDKSDTLVVWTLNAILTIIFYLIICTGICTKLFKKTTFSQS
jgi:hypothetical protein